MLGGATSLDGTAEAAGMILKQVPGLNRCIWNLGPRMPAKARPVAAAMTRERLDLLREADALVMDGLKRYGLYETIWQCPTVLVPLEFDGRGREPPDAGRRRRGRDHDEKGDHSSGQPPSPRLRTGQRFLFFAHRAATPIR
jgi:hypothetical protein